MHASHFVLSTWEHLQSVGITHGATDSDKPPSLVLSLCLLEDRQRAVREVAVGIGGTYNARADLDRVRPGIQGYGAS